MAQIKLIALADFNEDTIPLPEGMEEERLTTAVDEAQNTDLKPLLGAAQFADLIINRAAVKYVKLLDGETYTNANGEVIIYPGLKFALIYWTMAHFYLRQQTTVGTHGIVRKRDDRSDAVDGKEIARQVHQFRSVAMAYWNDVETYLREKKTTYPLYKSTCAGSTKSSFRINDVFGD